MGRTTKYLGARTVTDDQAKCLALIPLFPGERVERLRIDAYAAALTDNDVSNPIMMNWYGLGIPWPLVDAADPVSDGTQADYSTVAQYDSLLTQYLLSANEGTGEVFGGDVDIDPETTPQGDEIVTEDPLITAGPPGAYKFWAHEILARPYAAAGNDTIRFGDDIRMSIPGKAFTYFPWGQLLILAMVRNDASQTETNFNIELDDVATIRAFSQLRSGDKKRVGNALIHDAGTHGDFMRTVLFGGDNFIEASTIKDSSVKAYVKAVAHIASPYSRNMKV